MSLISKDNLSLTLQSIKKLLSNKADKSEINELISENTVQSDWNQNDEIQPDYIKNRPFYEYFLEEVVIVPEDVYDILSSRGQVFKGNFNMPIDGETYIVQFGDNIYEKKAEIGTFPPGYPARIGDLYDEFIIYLKPGEIWVETPSTGQKIIKIVNQNHRIKKIDEKYLPDSMSKNNPSGTGSFSLNRNPDSEIGEYSFAEGYNAKASGKYSHAEGYYTTASNSHSHAEGHITTASGIGSHAEGNNTTASGDYSHAEGDNTKASRGKSHAEGSRTEASGFCSHAEGYETKASGENSHAEGYSTKASGYYSHAEGGITEASGPKSHAEGHLTTASGENSHAEGYYTKASGENSHAEGYETKALGDYSHAEGYYENLPSRTIPGTNWLSANSTVLNITVPKGRDLSSYVNTYVKYENNFAFIVSVENLGSPDAVLPEGGSPNVTEDTWCFTLSNPLSDSNIQNATLKNYDSISIAFGQAAHAEGINTGAIGMTTHAEGDKTIALGNYSHTEGHRTIATGCSQHVQGELNIVDPEYNVNYNIRGKYAHIVGNGTSVDARSNAHTLDWSGNAWYSGDVYVGSTSGTNKDEGSKKLATEEYVNNAMAELEVEVDKTELEAKMNKTNPTGTGYFSLNRKAGSIIGDRAFAEGDNNVASGHYSHAEGRETTASGYVSHAEGYYTIASGWYSHAEGYNTEVSGQYSHVEGNNTIASGETQHIQGKFNLADSQSIYAHIVGNGTHFHDRSNAHTLDWEGNAWYSGDVYVGSTSGSNKDEGSKKLATEEFVNNKVAKISNTDWNDLKNNLSQSIDNPWYYPIDAAKIEIYYQDSLFCTFVRTNLMSERGTSYWKYSGNCNNISIRNTLYGENFDFNNEENQATVFFSDKFDRRYYDASGNGMMDVENNLIAKKNQSVTWLFGHLADMDENHVWNVINYSPITCNDCGKDNVALAMDMAHKYIAGLSNEPTSQNLKLTDTVTGIEYMITIVNGKVTLTEVSE